MTNGTQIFTVLLFYAYVEIHIPSEDTGLRQLPKIYRAFKEIGPVTRGNNVQSAMIISLEVFFFA